MIEIHKGIEVAHHRFLVAANLGIEAGELNNPTLVHGHLMEAAIKCALVVNQELTWFAFHKETKPEVAQYPSEAYERLQTALLEHAWLVGNKELINEILGRK